VKLKSPSRSALISALTEVGEAVVNRDDAEKNKITVE
jgi:hypothetical protein